MEDVRASLPSILATFRETPDAQPVHDGSHRRDEAVLLSRSRYERQIAAERELVELERLGAMAMITGDLSACGKVRFGPDEIADDDANLGPALRLVYRLIPSNTDLRQVESLCVGPRRDLTAYAVAAARLGPPSA